MLYYNPVSKQCKHDICLLSKGPSLANFLTKGLHLKHQSFILYCLRSEMSCGSHSNFNQVCIISLSHFAIATIFCLVTIDHTHNDVT